MSGVPEFDMMPTLRFFRFPWRHHLPVGLVLISSVMAGCGYDTYRERLDRTKEYYANELRLNSILDPKWAGPGVSLRPPKKLMLQAPPLPRAWIEDAAKFEPVALDPRAPVSPHLPISGIVGAWTMDVSLDAAAADAMGKCYLFVLSNGDRFRYEDLGAPEKYFDDLEAALMKTFSVAIIENGRADQNNSRYEATIPATDKWGKSYKFRCVHFVADKPINKEIWNADLYELPSLEVQDLQTAVLVMYPANARERLNDHVKVALETLDIEASKPLRVVPPPKEGANPLLPGLPQSKPNAF